MKTETQHTTHTPGPWAVFTTADSLLVRDVAGTHSLAEVYSVGDTSDTATPHANARLIAAAPALLDALKEADRVLSFHVSPNHPNRAGIRAAIAKAEGRA